MRALSVIAGLVLATLCARARGQGEEGVPEDKTRELEEKIDELKREYDRRIEALEGELERVREEGKARRQDDLRRKAQEFVEKKERERAVGDAAAKLTGPGSIVSSTLNEFNPRITVFGDFLGRLDRHRVRNEDAVEITDRMSFRELEADFRADIDPYAKAVAIIAAEEENPNEYEFSVEESYFDLHTIPGFEDVRHNLKFKVGRFRTDFGIVNTTHTHDLPWTSRPVPLIAFLGEEGDIENGVGVEYLVHNPWDEAITLSLQLVNGENEALLAGARSNDPAGIGRLSWHKQLTAAHEFQLGTSGYVGNAQGQSEEPNDPRDLDNEHRTAVLWGWDFYYRWRPEKGRDQTSLLWQTETYLLHREEQEDITREFQVFGTGIEGDEDAGVEEVEIEFEERDVRRFRVRQRWGLYSAVQYQFLKNFYAGCRFDLLSPPEFSRIDGYHHKEGLYLSYYTSEFLRFRLGFEHEEDRQGLTNDTLLFQVTWVFGSHPVEPYWVNR
ncbi:MAG: hypothetical protein HY720_13865 [Planctomycetes bacterium]|nr:hypothetical protein [Planctomycetota bacterium]